MGTDTSAGTAGIEAAPRSRTAAVTGAAGFLGSRLVPKLLAAGWDVRAVVPSFESPVSITMHDITIVEGDVTDPASLDGIFDGCDTVFHLAGIVGVGGNRPLMQAVNVQGVSNVISEAASAGALTIHVASVSALGPTPNIGTTYDESHSSPPVIYYEETKRDGYLAAVNHAASGSRVRFAFPGGIYGPGDRNRLTPTSGMKKFARRPVPVFGPSDSTQAFVHVDDAAEGILAIAERGEDGRGYILVESALPLGDMFTHIAESAGHRTAKMIPSATLAKLGPLVRLVSKVYPDPRQLTEAWTLACGTSYAYSGERARQELGWEPRPIAEGVAQVVADAQAEQFEWVRPMSSTAVFAGVGMAVLSASCIPNTVAARFVARIGVSMQARRAVLAAALAIHMSETAVALKRTAGAPRVTRARAAARTLTFGGPSMSKTGRQSTPAGGTP